MNAALESLLQLKNVYLVSVERRKCQSVLTIRSFVILVSYMFRKGHNNIKIFCKEASRYTFKRIERV
jgi:hypothetical protein